MREFKARKIEKTEFNIKIEIEFKDNGDRRPYSYPIGEGWETEINGHPKFIHDICRRIEGEELSKQTPVDINILKTHEGKSFKKVPSMNMIKPKKSNIEEVKP